MSELLEFPSLRVLQWRKFVKENEIESEEKEKSRGDGFERRGRERKAKCSLYLLFINL